MNYSEKPKSCPWCDAPTTSVANCLAEHFAFYEPGQFQYWRGNITMLGFWSGLRASICLSFPFINALYHWRHRKKRLVIDFPDSKDHP